MLKKTLLSKPFLPAGEVYFTAAKEQPAEKIMLTSTDFHAVQEPDGWCVGRGTTQNLDPKQLMQIQAILPFGFGLQEFHTPKVMLCILGSKTILKTQSRDKKMEFYQVSI